MGDSEKIAQSIKSISENVPIKVSRRLAEVLCAGGAVDTAQIERAELISISPVWDALYIPLETGSVPAFGSDGTDLAPENVWPYTWAHGTSAESATLILREMIVRPTVGGDTAHEHPGYGFYGQGAVGELSQRSAKTGLNNQGNSARWCRFVRDLKFQGPAP